MPPGELGARVAVDTCMLGARAELWLQPRRHWALPKGHFMGFEPGTEALLLLCTES